MFQPLTDKEIEFIHWRIWEPLRRDKEYRNDYYELQSIVPTNINEPYQLVSETSDGEIVAQTFDTVLEDNSAEEEFCNEWKLPPNLN